MKKTMNSNIRFDYWEEFNFSDMLDLYEIFKYHFDDRLDINFRSPRFFRYFALFLYKHSYKDKGLYDLKELHD